MSTYIKPKAILFDWDNTLVDTWPVIYQSLHVVFEEMGRKPWTMDEVKKNVHKSLRDSFPEIFGEEWRRAGEIYLKHFESIHLDILKPLDGAEQMLKNLINKDIYIAVVSNKTGHNLRKEVKHLNWDKYFSKVIGAKDAKADKPSPDPVYLALKNSNLYPEKHDIWFVGDTITDLECAYNSKCRSVYFGLDDLLDEQYKNFQPNLRFKSHAELEKVFVNF